VREVRHLVLGFQLRRCAGKGCFDVPLGFGNGSDPLRLLVIVGELGVGRVAGDASRVPGIWITSTTPGTALAFSARKLFTLPPK
jgi:hypothetical protein